ncbi:SPOR domain-containing protein [uncultured Desulfovibrio sp.]|uniref:SPOR domain-containing protein n=1 Tax=uncultured Desulfovibrio sp. TaxID=167968 RepID=UPI0026201B34|nr:SPOR domain-containing protein [uncultured Desulfovibrio sp.]
MAQPLRKIRQRIAPAVPKGGFSFTLPPLAAGTVCIVMLACIGWAFFMGYMVGHGQNPGEEMRELTGIGRPDRETLAEMDKAMAGSEDAGLRDKLADLSRQPVGGAPAAANASAAPAAAPAAKSPYPFNKPSDNGLAAWGNAPKGAAQPASEKTAAPAKPQAATNGAPLYDFVFQVAAFRNVDDADRLRQRLEGQGLRTRGQKSGKLTLVMVHMRGTDLDAANLKEELQRMRLGSPLQKSKKRVGGKPRPR